MASAKYYPHIDGLRAIAVLAVLFYHLNPHWMPAGYLGVDIFFVISGFVVSASVANFHGRFHEFLALFYARRFVRIVPALLVALWLTTVFTILFVPSSWLSQANVHIARAAHIGIANYALMHEETNYFSPRAEYNSYTHTWSLGIEEQFYVLFPFLFLPWLTWRSGKKFVPFFLLGLASASLAWAHLTSDHPQTFYEIIPRFWELSLGVVLYQISQWTKLQTLSQKKSQLLLTKAFELILIFVIGLCLVWPSLEFPGHSRIAAVFTTGILLLSLEQGSNFSAIGKALSKSAIRFVGRISYSLYLFHWPIIVLLRWTLGIGTILSATIAIFLSFTLATLTYYFVETPMRSFKSRTQISNGKIIFAGLLILFISSKLTKWAYQYQPLFSLSTSTRNEKLWDTKKALVEATDPKCTAIEEGVGDDVWQIQRPTTCGLKAKTIFVIGDSHAGAYDVLYRKLATETGITIRLYSYGGCSLIGLSKPLSESRTDCVTFLKRSSEDVAKRAGHGDILFLASLRLPRFGDQWEILETTENPLLTAPAEKGRAAAIDSARDELDPFLKAGLRIAIDLPKPIFKIPTFRCVDWFNRNNPVCRYGFSMKRDALLSYRAPIVVAIKRIQEQIPSLEIWDPFDALCPPNPQNTCEIFKGTQPRFIDTDHLTGFGNLELYESFAQFIEKISDEGPSEASY